MNMKDVRTRMGVKLLSWKIEKRMVERIGHVMRMVNERMVKVVVLGWYGKLEDVGQVPGMMRKTV